MRRALPLRAGGFSSGNRPVSYFKPFTHARPIRVLVTNQLSVFPTFLDVASAHALPIGRCAFSRYTLCNSSTTGNYKSG